MFVKTIDLEGKIYTDQTERFPVTSNRGHKYLCCAYDYDSNTIHAEPMKTKTGTELTATYQKIQTLLSERGLTPKLHILDNECPQVLKTFMNKVNENFQLVPPPHPPQKRGRTSHLDIQGPLHRRDSKLPQRLPPPSLVPPPTPRMHHSQPNAIIQHEP